MKKKIVNGNNFLLTPLDLNYGEWQTEPSSGHQRRTITYIIPLNYSIGPKSSQTEDKQILYKISKPGSLYILDAEVTCLGIPYGDTFMVMSLLIHPVQDLQAGIIVYTECWGHMPWNSLWGYFHGKDAQCNVTFDTPCTIYPSLGHMYILDAEVTCLGTTQCNVTFDTPCTRSPSLDHCI